MNSHTYMQLLPLSKIESLRWTRSSHLSFPRWSARVSSFLCDEFEEGHSPRVGPESSSCVLGFRSSEKGETGLRQTGEMGWFDEGSVMVGDDRNLELTSRDLAFLESPNESLHSRPNEGPKLAGTWAGNEDPKNGSGKVTNLSITEGKLISAGYTTLVALSSLSPSDLARELKIPESEALEILKVASLDRGLDQPDKNNAIVNGEQNAWEMLHEELSFPRITTSSDDLDNILGGGINYKEVTEVGYQGIGKTQMGIQLAVNVQIPVDLGGLGGKAVYVDTEGSFMVEWALQIAEASVVEMSNYNELLKKNRDCQVEIQPTDILDNIFYFRVCTYTEQIALINYLDKFILEHKDVKIVIVDSVTLHFRQDFEEVWTCAKKAY
ncbi:hypothetical protein ACFX1X_027992 [Malus domestica]